MGRVRRCFLILMVLGLVCGLSLLGGCSGCLFGSDTGDDDTDDDADDDTDDDQPPDFDGLQSATPDANGNIILSWNAATDTSTPITYNIYMATESGAQDFGNPLASTEDLNYTVPGLEICVEYFFVVRAEDAVGNEDGNTAEKSAKPVVYECDYSDEERVVWTFSVPWGPYDIETLAWISDVDGDDVADILVESFDSRANGMNTGDHLFCLSGATGEVIWSTRPQNDAGAGSGGWGDKCLNTSPDLNGDGHDDVLFGSAWGDRTAYAIDGTDGTVIWKFDSYTNPASPDSGWVYEIQPVPDITGDGVPETTFCLGSHNDSAYLVNGATGELVWRLTASLDAVESLAVLNDVDGDDLPDIAFGGGDVDEDRVFCVSGYSPNTIGQVIWTHHNLNSNWAMTSIGDIDDDGASEVIVGALPHYSTPCRVIAHSGADGEVLWTYTGLGYDWPMRIVNLGDVNGDGYDDVAVASWAEFVVALNGKTGEELWKVNTDVPFDDVWAVDAVDDITGDGIKDVVAGSFSSLVFTVDSASGDVLWGYDTGDSKLFSVRGVPDVTGDCVPDVVAGTQNLSAGDAGGGTVFLFEGCK